MKLRNMKQFVSLVLVFILLAGATHWVHTKIRPHDLDKVPPPQDVLYLPKGEYVRVISLGFDNFWADVLWLRTLQYFGGHYMGDKEYRLMDRLIEVITTLDPSFADVYSFGAMVLSEEMKRTDLADSFLDKGIKNNPKNWRLAYERGFLWFEAMRVTEDTTKRKQFADRAISAYATATTRPECPEFVSRIIYYMYDQKGEESVARNLWTLARDEAISKGDQYTAAIAQDKLYLMDFKKAAVPAQKAVIAYYEKNKKMPPDLQTLVSMGLIPRIPIDPVNGKPLSYDKRTGRVFSKEKPQFYAL